jgi:hypothetical protein
MNTISRAWHAAVDAIEEARNIGERGGDDETVRELLRHAHELMDVVDAELDEGRVQSGDPDFLRVAAAETPHKTYRGFQFAGAAALDGPCRRRPGSRRRMGAYCTVPTMH